MKAVLITKTDTGLFVGTQPIEGSPQVNLEIPGIGPKGGPVTLLYTLRTLSLEDGLAFYEKVGERSAPKIRRTRGQKEA